MYLRAGQACLACRRQKRKCDKGLPTCSLCIRMGRSCDYSETTPTPNADDFLLLRQRVLDLEARLERGSSGSDNTAVYDADSSPPHSRPTLLPMTTSSFPPMFFLDIETFRETHSIIQKPILHVPPEVSTYLGTSDEIRAIANQYLSTVHLWLPVVSKKRLELNLKEPQCQISADLALLLL